MTPHRFALLTLVAMAARADAAAGQVVRGTPDTASVVADPADVVSVGRSAQARFERRRVRLLPLSHESVGGSCDEVVGRICTTYDEGEWYPQLESREIVARRLRLLAELDSLQELAPSSGWLLGQRVWYRAEGGDWGGAYRVAAECGGVDPWWCLALKGFALHGLERYREAEATFERALARMDEAGAERWRTPRWPVDSDTRELLEDAEADPPRRAEILRRLWALADPLYLVDGNDRLTAHYARWTAATIRDGARNPFRLSWGDDLTQLTVRHGWQIGWERTPSRDYTALDRVVGHNHPLGRDYMPPGDAVEAPADTPADELHPGVRRPRSLYAPPYAPVLLPMEGQVAVFPRGRTMAVVATHFLPEDTTFHASHRHPVPWRDPGDQAEMPDRTGLFALPVERPSGRAFHSVRRLHSVDGASLLEIPTGDYVVSAESWSPPRRRAGRLRLGVSARLAPADVATLSDILLLRPGGRDPETLREALELALPRPRLRPGQPFAIGWEVAGLGFRPETLAFEVSVERDGRSVLSRVGDFLGLSEPPRPIALSWEEPGPTEPGHLFRYLALDLPELEEGGYEVRLTLRTAGRADAVTTRRFEVARER